MIDSICPPCEVREDFVPVPIPDALCPVPVVVERPNLLPTETSVDVVTDTYEDALRKVLRTYNCDGVPNKPEYTPVMVLGIPQFGIAGVPYQFKFTAVRGKSPYRFRAINGLLPDGLILNNETGLITGTPHFEGEFPFTIEVEDETKRTNQLMARIVIIPN